MCVFFQASIQILSSTRTKTARCKQNQCTPSTIPRARGLQQCVSIPIFLHLLLNLSPLKDSKNLVLHCFTESPGLESCLCVSAVFASIEIENTEKLHWKGHARTGTALVGEQLATTKEFTGSGKFTRHPISKTG